MRIKRKTERSAEAYRLENHLTDWPKTSRRMKTSCGDSTGAGQRLMDTSRIKPRP
jgi:hypothetical protein